MLPGAAALVDWYAVARDDRRTEVFAKPLVLVSLIVVALVLGASDSTAGGLAAGRRCSSGWSATSPCSATRSPASRRDWPRSSSATWRSWSASPSWGCTAPWWSVFGLAALSVALVATSRVLPETHRLGGPALSVPVAVYMAVIGAMLVLAWFTGEPLVAAGATVFVASDAILSVNRFVRPVPHGRLLLMVAYHVGQALIVAGVLGG